MTEHTVYEAIRHAAVAERNAEGRADFYRRWYPTHGGVKAFDPRTATEALAMAERYAVARVRLAQFLEERRRLLYRRRTNVLKFAAYRRAPG